MVRGQIVSWPQQFNAEDSLRGALSERRSAYDVLHYDLYVEIDTTTQEIVGRCKIKLKYLHKVDSVQIDLFRNLHIDQLSIDSYLTGYHRVADAVMIDASRMHIGSNYELVIDYYGIPVHAKNPPWDGGFVWRRDRLGRPWIGVACEGLGASSWWPCKDHLSDEPDSMRMTFSVPKGLSALSNGQLLKIDTSDARDVYYWKVSYPINTYNVSVTIGHHKYFGDQYRSDSVAFALNYYVLDYNYAKAKIHFHQVHKMLEAFEHYLGPYPFARDGYALIETPYVGMEHQSGIAYGNHFMRGYLGMMLPEDMDFDYIILHESAHEYWGNSVSAVDHGEMYLHEAFATYMEALYVEYTMGKNAALRYLKYQAPMIKNTEAILGPTDVHYTQFRTSDMYYKGSWFLHTLRSSFEDDNKWFDFLKSFYRKHAYGSVTSKDFERAIRLFSHRDYTSIIKQYLTHPQLPVLQYAVIKRNNKHIKIKYRWIADVQSFDLELYLSNKKQLKPNTRRWKKTCLDLKEFEVLRDLKSNYLIEIQFVQETKS